MNYQNVELAKVKGKIRALCEKTVQNGCSEAEANAAMQKIGELLSNYNLEMNEIDISEESCIELVFDAGQTQKTAGFSTMMQVAKLCDCVCWYNRGRTLKYHFFGMEPDVRMAIYLTEVIESAVNFETSKFKETPAWINSMSRRSASTSFQYGMVGRINARLLDMKRENDLKSDEIQRQRETTAAGIYDTPKTPMNFKGTSLVVLKNNKVQEEFQKKGMHLRSTHSQSRIRDTNSYSQGKVAGDRVNLNRPIGKSTGGYFLK